MPETTVDRTVKIKDNFADNNAFWRIPPRDQFLFITDLTIRGKAALMDLGVEFSPAFPVSVGL